MTAEPDIPVTPLDGFLRRYWRDREDGHVRNLREYLTDSPGHDIRIAREFIALERDGSGQVAATGSGDEVLGPYRILKPLGSGGQGQVYLAEDLRLRRKVALKVLTDTGPAASVRLDRFRREAEITSRLDHPAIGTIYDTGFTGQTAYIAMRHVEGETLAAKIARARAGSGSVAHSTIIDLSELASSPHEEESSPAADDSHGLTTQVEIMRAVRIVEQAARALHSAHEAGVIHRDVKPGNIMVTPEGEAVILDFGLARETEGDLKSLTQTGDFFGTPVYMSPEQIAAQRIRLDRRTDVWSLGVTLYECLSLRRPFDAPTREGVYQAILTKEPPDLRRLNPAISRDLKVVLQTAIEKDRDRRYQTALAFADDLRRLRAREPVTARPVGSIVRLGRWTQRNPILATATASLFLALAGGLVMALLLLSQRDAALIDKENAVLQATSEAAAKAEALARATKALEEKAAAYLRSEGLRLLKEAEAVKTTDSELRLLLAVEGAERLPEGDLSANDLLVSCLEEVPRLILGGHLGPVREARFSRDGRSVVSVTESGTARLWNVENGALRAVLRGLGSVITAEFSPDGQRVITASDDGTIQHWNIGDGAAVLAFQADKDGIRRAWISPDGRRILTVGKEGSARLCASDDGARAVTLPGHESDITTAAFSEDSGCLATASDDGEVCLWNVMDGARKAFNRDFDSSPYSLSFSHDGRMLAATCAGHEARILDAQDGTARFVIKDPEGLVGLYVCFSPDDSRVLTTSADDRVRMWSTKDGRLENVSGDGKSPLGVADFAPGGARMAFVSDWTITLQATAGSTELRQSTSAKPERTELKGHRGVVRCMSFAPDGRSLVTGSDDGTCRIWRIADDFAFMIDGLEQGHGLSYDGRRFIKSDGFGPWDARPRAISMSIWDTRSLTHVTFLKPPELDSGSGGAQRPPTPNLPFLLRSLQDLPKGMGIDFFCPTVFTPFSPDGERVLTGHLDPATDSHVVRVWDAELGVLLVGLRGHEKNVVSFCFSPDGRHVLTASDDHTARLWDLEDGGRERILWGHESGLTVARYSPDGRRVVTASQDKTARMWSAVDGKCLAVLEGHEDRVSIAHFSPDGQMVLTESGKAVRLWDAVEGRPEPRFVWRDEEQILVAEFSRDGRRLLTSSENRTRIRNVATGRLLAVIPFGGGRTRLTPDGTAVAISSGTWFRRSFRLWPTDLLDGVRRQRPRELTWEEVERFQIGDSEQREGIARLLAEAVPVEQIIRNLESLTDADPVILRVALAGARRLTWDPAHLVRMAWAVLSNPDASQEETRKACGIAEEAWRLGDRRDDVSLKLLGIARFRKGEFAGSIEAVREGLRLEQLNARRSERHSILEDLDIDFAADAVMAMAHHRSGLTGEAQSALSRLSWWTSMDDARKQRLRQIYDEAHKLIGAQEPGDKSTE